MARKQIVWISLASFLLIALGGYAWIGFDVMAWYRVRALAGADESSQAVCAEQVAELGWRVLPGLVGLLRREDGQTCRNAAAGLECLLRQKAEDPERPGRIERLAAEFASLSTPGKQAVLHVGSRPGTVSEEPARAAWGQVLAAVRTEDPETVRADALDLGEKLLAGSSSAETVRVLRPLIRTCLKAESPIVRIRAVQVSLHPGVELEAEVAALLRDSSPQVRKAALSAVGPAGQTVLDDTLLPCLRDSDADVQRLAEAVLRDRGLTPQHIRLGKMLMDPSPRERLKVLEALADDEELEVGVWLRRLSQDPADSVRATTVRVMADQNRVDLRSRLEQMHREDPSPTVSRLAGYYLRQKQE